MSDPVIIQLFISIAQIVVSVATVFIVRRVEKHTNGMKTELVNLTAKTSFAAGIQAEKDRR